MLSAVRKIIAEGAMRVGRRSKKIMEWQRTRMAEQKNIADKKIIRVNL